MFYYHVLFALVNLIKIFITVLFLRWMLTKEMKLGRWEDETFSVGKLCDRINIQLVKVTSNNTDIETPFNLNLTRHRHNNAKYGRIFRLDWTSRASEKRLSLNVITWQWMWCIIDVFSLIAQLQSCYHLASISDTKKAINQCWKQWLSAQKATNFKPPLTEKLSVKIWKRFGIKCHSLIA